MLAVLHYVCSFLNLLWIECGCAFSLIHRKLHLHMKYRTHKHVYICGWATFYPPLDSNFSSSHHLSASVTLTSRKCKALLRHELLISPSLSYSLQLFIRVTISALPRVVQYRVSLVSCFPAHTNDWQQTERINFLLPLSFCPSSCFVTWKRETTHRLKFISTSIYVRVRFSTSTCVA